MSVSGNQVTVTVQLVQRMQLLSMVGINQLTVSGTGRFAQPTHTTHASALNSAASEIGALSTVAVLTEAAAAMRGHAARRLPVAGALQPFAGHLVAAVAFALVSLTLRPTTGAPPHPCRQCCSPPPTRRPLPQRSPPRWPGSAPPRRHGSRESAS